MEKPLAHTTVWRNRSAGITATPSRLRGNNKNSFLLAKRLTSTGSARTPAVIKMIFTGRERVRTMTSRLPRYRPL